MIGVKKEDVIHISLRAAGIRAGAFLDYVETTYPEEVSNFTPEHRAYVDRYREIRDMTNNPR